MNKNLQQTNNKIVYRHLVLKFSLVFSFTAIILSVIYNGPISDPDTYQFIEWSDLLIQNSFNLLAFYSLVEFWIPTYFYTTLILLFSILRSIFPETWQIFFLILNLFSILTILWCFYSLRKKITSLVWPLAIAPILFLMSDLLVWASHIATDTYFAALVMFGITLIFKKEVLYPSFSLFLTLALLAISRPTSPSVIIGLVLIFVLLKTETYNLIYKHIKALVFSLIGLSALFFAFLIGNTEVSNELIDGFRSMAFAGEVIRFRPETWLSPSERFTDLIILFLVRFISFFQIWVSDFSLIHNILNSIFNTFFILSSLCFIFCNFIFNKQKSTQYQLALFLLIIAGSLFHSGTLIDFDWRYRYVYAAPMALFSAITFEKVILYFRSKKI